MVVKEEVIMDSVCFEDSTGQSIRKVRHTILSIGREGQGGRPMYCITHVL